jgi:cytochrome c553
MVRDRGPFKLANPWPKIAWGMLAGVVAVSAVLGFAVLSRYQQNDPTLDLWSAICRGLGLAPDIGPAKQPAPPLRTPTRIAWSRSTLDRIAAGDAQRGAFIALNCTACHGEGGVSRQSSYPTLAGMDAAAIYKEFEDFRSGQRSSGVMNAIARVLSDQDSADVAAYFATREGGLTAAGRGGTAQRDGTGSKEDAAARYLVFVGDPQRGLPPCAACHGPLGYKIAAPPLMGQQAGYIERQLASFAQGIRHNDINEQMRTPGEQLTPDEMRMIAAYYGVQSDARVSAK